MSSSEHGQAPPVGARDVSGTSAESEAVDALILALAIQAGQTSDGQFARTTLACLADGSRQTTRILLSAIGHLAHYGSGPDVPGTDGWLRALYEQLIAELRRTAGSRKHGLLPGDVVEVIKVKPGDHFTTGEPMVVWHVGDDGTVDIGFESLDEDYVGSTVQATNLRRISQPAG